MESTDQCKVEVDNGITTTAIERSYQRKEGKEEEEPPSASPPQRGNAQLTRLIIAPLPTQRRWQEIGSHPGGHGADWSPRPKCTALLLPNPTVDPASSSSGLRLVVRLGGTKVSRHPFDDERFRGGDAGLDRRGDGDGEGVRLKQGKASLLAKCTWGEFLSREWHRETVCIVYARKHISRGTQRHEHSERRKLCVGKRRALTGMRLAFDLIPTALH